MSYILGFFFSLFISIVKFSWILFWGIQKRFLSALIQNLCKPSDKSSLNSRGEEIHQLSQSSLFGRPPPPPPPLPPPPPPPSSLPMTSKGVRVNVSKTLPVLNHTESVYERSANSLQNTRSNSSNYICQLNDIIKNGKINLKKTTKRVSP